MSYEDRFEAMQDQAWELAQEWLYNGDMDESIIELIMDGAFDKAVMERARCLQHMEREENDYDHQIDYRLELAEQEAQAIYEAEQDRILAQQELEDICKDSDMDNYYDGSDHDNDFED